MKNCSTINRALAAKKKLFFLFVAVVMAASVMAEGHMKFKGIELDGSLPAFVSAMRQQKFTLTQQDADVAIMQGVFNGRKSHIYIYTTTSSHKVYYVAVVFDDSGEEWSSIWNLYSTYKDRLQTKYGFYTKQVEENRCSYSQDDPLYSIRHDQAEYKTVYEGEGGNVMVAIINMSYPIGVQVSLGYLDSQNYALNEAEVIEDL